MLLQTKRDNLENLATEIAKEHNLEARLVFAVIQVESNWNTYAFRYEPNFRWLWNVEEAAKKNHVTVDSMVFAQKTSFGLLQVMGAVAYEHELMNEENPHERLPTVLCNPWHGIVYGCRHLQLKSDLYGPDPELIYAAYNAGSPRRKNNGKLINQASVDRFMKNF